MVAELTHRTASLDDIEGIWCFLKQTASDVAVRLETEIDQEKALTELMACCAGPYSPIVVDGGKNVVGALLAKRDLLDWGVRNVETINVSLAAVAPEHRDQGVFEKLFAEIVKRNAPVYISVKPGEPQGLADRLKSSGFQLAVAGEHGEIYKWEPAPSEAKTG